MKKNARSMDILAKMAPGALSRAGFLGFDERPLVKIVEADGAAVAGLGTTHEAIAAKLVEVFDEAEEAMGNVVRVGDHLTAFHREALGRIPCPFGQCGSFHKGQVEVADPRTGEKLVFTPLSIHLITAHGFYQGRGSPYRIEPDAACRVLGIPG